MPTEVTRHGFQVRGRHEGRRIDAYLAARFTDCSRSYFQRLLKAGQVLVNGRPVKASTAVHDGDEVVVDVAVSRPDPPAAEDIPLDILHEDADLIAIAKPAGLVVHPARGHSGGTLVNALLHHCRALAAGQGGDRAGIVHRLDKDTSGVLVACKDDRIRSRLASQFEHRRVRKTYLALVEGVPEMDGGVLKHAIGRHPKERKKMAVRREGKAAETAYEVLERFKGFAWMRFFPKTGRTHQIRVHAAAMGHPVVADPRYGKRTRLTLGDLTGKDPDRETLLLERQALHAARLEFAHPRTEEPMAIEAALPADLERTLAALRRQNRLPARGRRSL